MAGAAPLQALALTRDWQRLLDVVQWLQQHPRPGIYARQIDVAGVHSKFVEAHRAVLADLLDQALPEDAIDRGASGAGLFEERYGLLRKPLRIRLRLLDPALLAGPWGQDVTLDAEPFAQLPLSGARVFMTENETNFLTLPAHPRGLVVLAPGMVLTCCGRRNGWPTAPCTTGATSIPTVSPYSTSCATNGPMPSHF